MSDALTPVPDEVVVHRIGGSSIINLTLKAHEVKLAPPGISLLCEGTPAEAAEAMRRHFPRMAPRGQTAVGSTTVSKIRGAGFEVINNPTPRFPQHSRLIHPLGAAGFTEENLKRLALCFTENTGL